MSKINDEKQSMRFYPITINEMDIISEQMKKCIFKIENNNGVGTGFFCYIPYKNEKLKVMITSYTILNEDIIKHNKTIEVSLNDNKVKKIINFEDKNIYTNFEYNITIINIDSDRDKVTDFLELDEKIFNENIKDYNDTNIYTLQYHKYNDDKKASVSFGILKEIKDNYTIVNICFKGEYYKGAPILQLSNKKIIGMQNSYSYFYDTKEEGIFLKNAINEYLNNIKENNEINMEVKIEKDDINQKIYFFKLQRFNMENIKIFINNKEYKKVNFFEPKNEGIYSIKIKINYSNIKDIQHMFSDCSNIINIDLSSFNTENVTNMMAMFSNCLNLKSINLSNINTQNVTNMFYMFGNCRNLINLDLSSFDTQKVNNTIHMFYNCSKLNYIDLSSFDLRNTIDASCMFEGCDNLKIVKVNKNISKIYSQLRWQNLIDEFGNIINKNTINNNVNNNLNNNDCNFNMMNNKNNINNNYLDNNFCLNNFITNNMNFIRNSNNNNEMNNILNNGMKDNINNNMGNNIHFKNNNMNNNIGNSLIFNNYMINNMRNCNIIPDNMNNNMFKYMNNNFNFNNNFIK